MKTGKRVLAFVLAMVMLLCLVPMTFAEEKATSGKCGDNVYWKLQENTLTISGTGSMKNFGRNSGDNPWENKRDSIEKVIIEKGVTTIGDKAFEYCSNLKTVIIPEGVTTIGDGAFFSCDALETISIPDSVKKIGIGAFNWTAFYFNESNWSEGLLYLGEHLINSKVELSGECAVRAGTRYIASGAFIGTSLTKVIIPNSVEQMGDAVFCDCYDLESVTIPNSVKEIGLALFQNCSSLTNVTLSESLKTLTSTFDHCSSLNNVTVPNSVTEIGMSVFYGCTSLTNITIPNSVKSIGNSAFRECKSLKDIKIPNNVTRIDEHVFNGCISLASVTIPNNVTNIFEHAFDGCIALANVTIPNSVASIYSDAFNGCSSLKDVYYQGTEKQWKMIHIDDIGNDSLMNATVHFSSTDPITPPSTEPSTQPTTEPTTEPIEECEHSPLTEVFWAEINKDGYIETFCEDCGLSYSKTVIPAIKTVKLSKTKYTYDGKRKTPSVTVLDREGKKLVEGTDYTVKYSSGRKKIGKYKVEITFDENYCGTKTLSFQIVPAKVTGLKATAGKKLAQLKWTAVKGATNYVVYYATKKDGTYKKAFITKGATAKVKKLKSGKTYYFRVRALSKLDSGNFYGAASAIKKVKIK